MRILQLEHPYQEDLYLCIYCILYSKKSVNLYSLLFSMINMISSSLWITYSQMKTDTPLLIRGVSDLFLFTISSIYILSNRVKLNKLNKNQINDTTEINDTRQIP